MRDGSWVWVLALSMGCQSSTTPAPAPPPPPVAVPSASSDLGSTRPAGAPDRGEEGIAGPGELLVGVLGQNGHQICRKGGPHLGEWVDLYPEVGFVALRVDGGLARQTQALQDKLVVVRGSRTDQMPSADPPPPSSVPCGMMQMRSDWEQRPGGFKIRRGPVAPMPAFQAVAIAEFQGLSARVDGPELHVRFENTLGRTLPAAVTLRLHYEGCFGKPGTTSESRHRAQELPPDAVFEARFPTGIDREGGAPGSRQHNRHSYRAASLQILVTAPDITFDLDAPLPLLGAQVACP